MDDVLMAPGALDAEAENLERRKKYADMLRQQAGQTPQGQMVSGIYVAPSWTQHAANLLKSYMAGQEDRSVGEDKQKLAQALQARRDNWLGQMPQGEADATPEKMISWALQGSQIDPQAAGLGLKYGDHIQARQARADEMKARAEQRQQEIAAQNQFRMEQARQAAAERENMIRLSASLRPQAPEPLVPVLAPGSQTPVLMPRSNAVGMTPWNPQAAKTQMQAEEQQKGKQLVSDSVAELKNYYDVLKGQGAITSVQNGPLANAGAKIANTPVGQFGASIMGTEAQKARESIAQARPLLMSAIKNATGMSAQQMNSNAELQFYMQAATDPSKGYEANMDALKRLDKMFGLGLTGAEEPKPSSPTRIRYDAQGNPVK